MVVDTDQDRPGGGQIRTLVRGLLLLELISESSEGATVTDLAERAGLDKGTASRLLATLRDTGWAYQAPEDRRYRLAGKALALSHDYTNRVDLRGLAMPLLAELRDVWDEAIHLGAVEGDEVVYVERLESRQVVRVVSIVGHRAPISCTAMGKAFLAALPRDLREARLRDLRLVRSTERSITDPDAFRAELSAIAERGYAVDDEENNDDVICVGVAVTDVTRRPIGTISISGPAFRMRGRLAEIGRSCAAAASSISAALGDSSKAVH